MGDPDLDGFICVHVEGCLGCQRSYGLPDHAGDEENHQVDRKFSEHVKEMEREDWVFGNVEVIEEASDKDETADGNGGCDKGFRVGCLSKVGQAYQENG